MKGMKLLFALLVFFGTVTHGTAQDCRSDTNIPPSSPTSHFNILGDGTVTDSTTGLMWARCSEGLSGQNCATGTVGEFTWKEALDQAHGSSLAGYGDWRLPNIKELQSIIEEQCYSPAVNLAVFPNTDYMYFWSASPFAVDSSNGWAWFVDFHGGSAWYQSRYNTNRIRLVRSGQ